MFKRLLFTLAITLVCRAQGGAGQGPVFKLLYSPPFYSNLGTLGQIFEVKPGLFYVVSAFTGGGTGGSVFSVTSTGTVNTIYAFPPETLMDWAVEATNGKIYGPATAGYYPHATYSYYSMDLSGKDLQEYLCPTPWAPGSETTVAPPNQMYDIVGQITYSTTPTLAFANITESGKITILHQFSSSDGYPSSFNSIVLGPDGNFYGIGNQQPSGISPTFIYRFTPSGAYSQLLTFMASPLADALPLVAASDGNLYGSFPNLGANNTGLIYQATLSGKYTVMASYPPNINAPRSLMQAADGNLYATDSDNIFRYNFATHAITPVYHMNLSQGNCPCRLVEGMDGKLYGTAPSGGPAPALGTVFSLDVGLPRPLPVVSGLYPSSGKVGQEVLLWGEYLLGADSVTFNGVPASGVNSTSVHSVSATVPAGATTGPVTITTINGSFTTTQNFTVQ